MSESSDTIEWYLAREGQQHGPLSDVELNKFIELGHLKPMDLLWRAGFDDWRPATDVFPPRPPTPLAEPSTPANFTATAPSERPRTEFESSVQSETTQPIRKHSVPRDDQSAATAAPDAGAMSASQSAETLHQEPRVEFEKGHPNAAQAPGTGQPTSARPVDPTSGHAQPSSRYGHPQNGPSAVTQRPEQPSFGSSPQTTELRPSATAARAQDEELDDDEFLEDEADGRSGWLMVAAALFLFVLLGAGGLFAYNNQQQISALYADLAGNVKPNSDVAVVRAPKRATREAANSKAVPGTEITSLNAPKPSAPVQAIPELPILKSKLWQFAQREFGSWTKNRLAELAEEKKSKQEANDYLIASFVQLRRENAAYALLASPGKLELVANSFVQSLKVLTAKGVNSCYAFISNGEGAPEIAPLFFEPSVSSTLEAQMLAVLQAISEGIASPTKGRKPPTADDFDALSAELGKRGWTAADLKLFSDPTALSKAKPKLVCRLVTEWFATQTKLGDQAVRDQLIAASLRPVIGG